MGAENSRNKTPSSEMLIWTLNVILMATFFCIAMKERYQIDRLKSEVKDLNGQIEDYPVAKQIVWMRSCQRAVVETCFNNGQCDLALELIQNHVCRLPDEIPER